MFKKESGWDLLDDRAGDDFGLFRTRRSMRRNQRNGAEYDFFLIDGLDWVNVIALTEKREIVLVKQYRHGMEGFTLELPGGCIDLGEDPAHAAARELREETGYTTDQLQRVGVSYANPAMMSIRAHAYFTPLAYPRAAQQLDGGEAINVVLKPIAEFREMIQRGEFNHGVQLGSLAQLMTTRPDALKLESR